MPHSNCYYYNFRSIFCIWAKTCNICHSELGLSHSSWRSTDPSILLKMTLFYSLLWLTSTPHFIYPFISCWAPSLIL
jgi:hypothetical protein